MKPEIERGHAHIAAERAYNSHGAKEREGLPLSAILFLDPKSQLPGTFFLCLRTLGPQQGSSRAYSNTTPHSNTEPPLPAMPQR